jgi:CubicO group peptidase (beta-lactamase class C family)
MTQLSNSTDLDPPEKHFPRLVRAIEQGVTEGLHTGAQMYVSIDGQPVADFAIGEARPGAPMTRHHLTLWMSSVKPVMAVAIALLWEQERLRLDDPIALHVPEFGQNGKDHITIRHALTHTGGFRMARNGGSYDEVLQRIYEMRPEPSWIAGRTAGYHVHSGWYVLAELVYRLTGRRYAQFVREEIFLPLGMRDSWIGMSAEAFRAYGDRLAGTYRTSTVNTTGAVFSLPTEQECADARPSGNGRGPIHELGRFYEMLLLLHTRNGVRIVSPQTVEAVTARHRSGVRDMTFKHIIDWGLGFIIDSKQYGQPTVPYGYGPHASPRTFGHGGYESANAFADPEHRLVVAWVCNGMPGNKSHQQRNRAINAAVYEDLNLTD